MAGGEIQKLRKFTPEVYAELKEIIEDKVSVTEESLAWENYELEHDKYLTDFVNYQNGEKLEYWEKEFDFLKEASEHYNAYALKNIGELDTLWEEVERIDTHYNAQIENISAVLKACRNKLDYIRDSICPPETISLTEGLGAYFLVESGIYDNKISAAKMEYGCAKTGISKEQAESLRDSGYSDAEIAALLWSAESEADQQALQYLLEKPPRNDALFSTDPKTLGEQFKLALAMHSRILQRTGEAIETAIEQGHKFFLTPDGRAIFFYDDPRYTETPYADLQDFVNGLMDLTTSSDPDYDYTDYIAKNGLQVAWLETMYMNSTMLLEADSYALAIMLIDGDGVRTSDFELLEQEKNRKQMLTGLWADLYTLCPNVDPYAPSTADDPTWYGIHRDGFRISGLDFDGGTSLQFACEYYDMGIDSNYSLNPTNHSIEVNVESILQNDPGAWITRGFREDLLALYNQARDKTGEMGWSLIGIACSLNPAAAAAYTAVSLAMALAGGNGGDSLKEGEDLAGKGFDALGGKPGWYGGASAGVKTLAAILKWQQSLKGLSAEERKVYQDEINYWLGAGASLDYTVDGKEENINAYTAPYSISVLATFGKWSQSEDGVMFLFPEGREPEHQLATDAYANLKSQWGSDLTDTQKFFLYGEDSGVSIENIDFHEFTNLADKFEKEIMKNSGTSVNIRDEMKDYYSA